MVKRLLSYPKNNSSNFYKKYKGPHHELKI